MTSTSLTPGQKRGVIIAAAVGALLFVIYVIAALGSGNSAPAGSSVAGVDISGLSQEEAADAVASALSDRVTRPVRITADGVSFRVKPADAGLTLDADASVAPAFGRTWNPFALLGLGSSGQELPPVAAVDPAALESEMTQLADAVAVAPVEPRIVMRSSGPRLKEGVNGRTLDLPAASAELEQAFVKVRRPIEAPMVEVPPTISPEAAESAMSLARTATSAPIIVEADTLEATLTGAEIASALSFTAEGGALVPKLDGAKLHAAIADQLSTVETPGRDASFAIRKGVPRIVSSKVGRGVEDEELAAAVASVMGNSEGDRTVRVSVGVREPKLTTAEAAQLGITEKISSFTQSYPYAAYRSQNIGQAAERINGTLLMPGETFSLNDTILERTVENGYTTGYVVGEGGVFREDLGGGVSTSATATWTAAFYAGMERVQNVAHSIWISRYEPGLEATVAWGIFDLKFRNDLQNAVFITAGTTPTSITVSFWGTPEYDRIEAVSGPRTNIVEYSKLYNEDPDCSPQGGIDGFTITVDRVFYKDGQEVRREPITTRYKPAPQVLCKAKPKKDKPGKKNDEEFAGEAATEGGAGEASSSPSATGQPGKQDTAAASPEAAAPSSDKPNAKASAKPSAKPSKKESQDSDVFSN